MQVPKIFALYYKLYLVGQSYDFGCVFLGFWRLDLLLKRSGNEDV